MAFRQTDGNGWGDSVILEQKSIIKKKIWLLFCCMKKLRKKKINIFTIKFL